MHFKRGLPRKIMTRKISYGILNEIKELELNYMEHHYMSIKGFKRGHGKSSNLKLVVKSHIIPFNMVKLIKRVVRSLGLVYFNFHSLTLILDQINNTEPYSLCIH